MLDFGDERYTIISSNNDIVNADLFKGRKFLLYVNEK